MSSPLPWIISIDDHVVEPPDVWTSRLPARYRDVGPRVVRDTYETVNDPVKQITRYVKGGDGPVTDWWVYEDLLRPIPQVMACAGFPPESLTLDPIAFDEMRRGCWDPAARLADMDVNRTERSLCFPTFPRFAGQQFLEAKDKDLALLCVQAYNDWMIDEWCGPTGGRLIPLCLVPLWDPVAAAAEVRRNAARGCRAVCFTELPANLGLPTIHDPNRWWDPFLQACDETGTVIFMHIGSGSVMPSTGPDAPAGVKIALTFVNAELSLVDWLLSGVLFRFPNLKIAYAESQVGWMPFVFERVDKLFVKSAAWAELDPVITEVPSSVVPGRVFGCFFDDDAGIEARDAIGVGQLVFETDYPHQDTTWPDTAAVLERMRTLVGDDDDFLRIVRTNAIEMLGLDPRPLVPGATG